MDGREQQLAYAAALLLAAGLAWTRGVRFSTHRILGTLLTWQLSCDVIRMSLAVRLDAAGAWPLHGVDLAFYWIDHAVMLSPRFTILAAIWVHFGRWRVVPVAAGYLATLLGLVVYKSQTGATLVPVHQWVAGVTAALGAAIIVARAIGVLRGPRDGSGEPGPALQPDGAHAALLILAATDLANALAHASHTFDAWWPELRYADTLAVMVVAVGYSVAFIREASSRWHTPSRR